MAPSALLPLANRLSAVEEGPPPSLPPDVLGDKGAWWEKILAAIGRGEMLRAQTELAQARALANLARQAVAATLNGIVHLAESYQEQYLTDPTSTDPTHSLLAKDHADHPLHVLAAELAKIAVEDVGWVIVEAWRRDQDAVAALIPCATKYLCHPDFAARAGGGLRAIVEKIDQWRKDNPEQLRYLASDEFVQEQAHHARAERQDVKDALARFVPSGDVGAQLASLYAGEGRNAAPRT